MEVAARLPVSIEPQVPIEVSSGDTLQIPVAVANDSTEAAAVTLGVHHKNLTADPLQSPPVNLQTQPSRQ